MKYLLNNLAALKKCMVVRGWVITCFVFVYKKKSYFVLVQRYVPPRTAPVYQIVELTFVDCQDSSRTLTAAANRRSIDVGARKLREFFGIEFSFNLGELLQQFYSRLGEFIPVTLPEKLPSEEQRVVLRQLDRRDGEQSDMVYFFDVRRNGLRADGTLGQRSFFNSQKTMMLRPTLYEHLGAETYLSFFYSADPDAERDDTAILDRVAIRRSTEI